MIGRNLFITTSSVRIIGFDINTRNSSGAHIGFNIANSDSQIGYFGGGSMAQSSYLVTSLGYFATAHAVRTTSYSAKAMFMQGNYPSVYDPAIVNYAIAFGNYAMPNASAQIAIGSADSIGVGTNQKIYQYFYAGTTNATPLEMTASADADDGRYFLLRPNTVVTFKIEVFARHATVATENFARWTIYGTARRLTSTVVVYGSLSSIAPTSHQNASSWRVDVAAAATPDRVAITVTGEASNSIRWHAEVETTSTTQYAMPTSILWVTHNTLSPTYLLAYDTSNWTLTTRPPVIPTSGAKIAISYDSEIMFTYGPGVQGFALLRKIKDQYYPFAPHGDLMHENTNFQAPHYQLYGAAISPDKTWLALLWTGRTIVSTLNIFKYDATLENYVAHQTFSYAASTSTGHVAISPDSTQIAVGFSSSTYLRIFDLTGTTWSEITPLSADATSSITSVAYNSDGSILSVGQTSSPYVYNYQITGGGSTYTRLANPASLPAGAVRGISFTHDSTTSAGYQAVAHDGSPGGVIYKITAGPTFTKLTGASGLQTNLGGNGNWASFKSDGLEVAFASSTSPFIQMYTRSGDVFTKISNPTTLPSASCPCVAYSTPAVPGS
jgi:WD40 repeat protein